MDQPELSGHQRGFFKIARFASALAFGFLGGAMAALEKTSAGFAFKFNAWVLAAFVAGIAIAWGYWTLVLAQQAQGGSSRKSLRLYTAFLIVLALLCFLYPLRFIAKTN